MVWILPVFEHLVNCDLFEFSGENRGEVMVNLWWNHWKSVVAMQESKDVHYLGLELSEFGQISAGREPGRTTCCV
jgi:hypothetical protein